MTDIRLRKYAELLIKLGVNLKPDQYLIIEASVDASDLVLELTKVAFQQKAKDVIVFYSDPFVDRERALNLDPNKLKVVEAWQAESRNLYLRDKACSLLIKSTYPYLYQDVSEEAASALQIFNNELRNNIRSFIASDDIQWCIASYPNKLWADVLFPSDELALDKMFDLMYDICRVNLTEDTTDNWIKHLQKLGRYSEYLNQLKLDSLHFKNSLGTDLVIGLHENNNWSGGVKEGEAIKYVANIPTEEVACSPDKYRADGIVYASKPLESGGAIIEDFYFELKDGKIIKAFAKKNNELLNKLIDTDEGSRYLGEIALVEDDSPISNSGKLFYNTLYDENAACHIAFGKGFPSTRKDLGATDYQAWEANNLNFSKVHIDFMFGTADMDIVGYDKEGNKHQIFKNGNFVKIK